MMFKTHLAFSFLVSILLWPIFQNSGMMKWAYVTIFLFASLLPDIDKSDSFLGKHFKIIGWIFAHRGLFHSIFPIVVIGFFVQLFFGFLYMLVIVLGYLSHLVLDMLNHQGVGLFFPIIKWRIKGFLKGGGLFENIVFLLCVIGILLFQFF